ncbi:MAG: hypothetical protein CML40_08240 [Rhodobacteraceae bacterium]|nr:MAG: hypothetical protein CML40_08240 [Paracoccaceae bacterium]
MEISKKIFKKNINCLNGINPQLAVELKKQDQNKIDFEIVSGHSHTIRISGLQLSSRHNPQLEAELQASYMIDSDLIVLYGVGLGCLPEKLLERRSLSKLRVKILNLSLFSLILSVRDQTSWLCDERVTISLACSDLDIEAPYFVNFPDLLLADEWTQNIKNILYSNNCDNFSKKQFKKNDHIFLDRIQENYSYLEKDKGVEFLVGTASTEHAVVVGAGPSLESTIIKLGGNYAQNKRPVIIAVGTASKMLVRAGIIPDYVVIIDKDVSSSHPLVANFSKMQQTTLIYSPFVQTELIESWEGDRYVTYWDSPLFDQIKQIFPKGSLFSGGSVIHTAIDLARNLGCINITLYGVDFAYRGNQTHAGNKNGPLTNYENIIVPDDSRRWVKDGYGNKVSTHDSFIGYLVELESYVKRYPEIRFSNASKMGAFIQGCNYVEENL